VNSNVINVGIGEARLITYPHELRTVLGSCVALCLYDTQRKSGALAHIVLPHINNNTQKLRYADSASPVLLDMMLNEGSDKKDIVARIAGGARMYVIPPASPLAQIGLKTAGVVQKFLQAEHIPIISSAIGGDHGITVNFHTIDGRLTIRQLNSLESMRKRTKAWKA
jgi:chemotaxis protein CheD